jgi:hypothetical protein
MVEITADGMKGLTISYFLSSKIIFSLIKKYNSPKKFDTIE